MHPGSALPGEWIVQWLLLTPFIRGVRIMSFKWDRVHVWSGEVADQAGGVASKLAELARSINGMCSDV